MKKDYYEVLEVSKAASTVEIKKAYRKQALRCHPDKNPGDKETEEKFKQTAKAYEILSGGNKYAQYDRFGHAAFEGGMGDGGFSMDDIFSQFGDIFGGHFSDFSGGFGGSGGGGQQQMYIKNDNLRIRVKVTLEDIVKGTEKKIKICCKVKAEGTTYKTCLVYNGQGQIIRRVDTMLGMMQTVTTCSTCGGAGEVIGERTVDTDAQELKTVGETIPINIPARVVDGIQLQVNGKGNEAPIRNGVAGDLLVTIEKQEHSTLKREGDNLHYDLYISIPEAVLGTTKEIETATGRARIKLDEGMQSGKILRLRGKDVPNLRMHYTGGLIIHVNVWTPRNLTDKQKAFFREMLDNGGFTPKPDKDGKPFSEKVREVSSQVIDYN